ncbi:Beta-1,4 N-acetylgalactosaminyltransferase 1 [Branchiostoma belcheri]|nr:Beta-1,4 N-acetylgalactosaminyltransferase 1 [Branchiostoma belcheri]
MHQQGYFAGRNLGLSQVHTEYFFYQDDDFEITEGTKLDRLVLFLDKTNFHLGTAALDSPTVSEQNDRKRDFVDLTSADPNNIPEAGFRRSRFHNSESDISNGILRISEFRT